MAKNKKTVSKKDLLEEALIPDDEQPYKVPDNWVWTRLGNITQITGGGTPPTNVREYYENGKIPWITPLDLSNHNDIYISQGRKNITYLGLKKSSARLLPKDTVLLSTRAPIGYVAIAQNELCTNQGFKSFIPSGCYLPKYLYYYLKSCKGKLESYASGTTFLELSGRKVAPVEFPMPPLPEQQRIVDRIESLFAKLDHAKDLIQNALDSFETRKAAILHKALTGELTQKWREENGVGMNTWEEKTLGEVCKSIFDGDHMPPPKSEDGVPFLVISNINKGKLSLENTRFVPRKYYESLTETRRPQFGDVLYSLVGSYGIPVLIDSHREFCFQRHIALLKPQNIDSRFLWYLLQAREMYEKATRIATGTAQLTVPIKGLRQLNFMKPSLNEQQEIVRILDAIFAKEQQAKELYDLVDNIDLIKRAILARAFRGELGTNDPSEESSLELLKKVLADRSIKDKS